MIDDTDLAGRSIRGFGEMLATLGRWSADPNDEVRRPDALGARILTAADNPWFNAAVVPAGAAPPADDPGLPDFLWSLADAVPGRLVHAEYQTPCMGIELHDAALETVDDDFEIATPSLATLGDMNERAYGEFGVFSPLVTALRDERVRTHGLRVGGEFVCVALTLNLGDDVSIQYVATEASQRRRGLASRLLRGIFAATRAEGVLTATLQASPDGLSVYEKLGFRRVATLRAFVRPAETG